MEEFIIIFHTSVGCMGSARCFSLGVCHIHTAGYQWVYRHLKTRGAESLNGSHRVSHQLRARPRQLHTASPCGSGFSWPYCSWILRSLPRVSSRDARRSYKCFKTQPPKSQNISSTPSCWWRKPCGRSIFEARRTRIHSFFFPSFFYFISSKVWWDLGNTKLYTVVLYITKNYYILLYIIKIIFK